MGELREPKFISQKESEKPELLEDEEDEKFIEAYFKRSGNEQEMLERNKEEAAKKGKGDLYKKISGFLAGLTLLGAVGAAPVHADSDVFTKTIGKIIERGIGAWERTDIEKERTKRATAIEAQRVEQERIRREAEVNREKERTKQTKTKTGGDIVETKIEEEEKTERKRIETGVEEHEKNEKTGISGPFGDINTEGTVKSKEKGPPQSGEENMPSKTGSEKERIEKLKQGVNNDYLLGRPVGADIFKQFSFEERTLYTVEWNRLEKERHETGRYFQKNPKGGWLFGKPEAMQKKIDRKK